MAGEVTTLSLSMGLGVVSGGVVPVPRLLVGLLQSNMEGYTATSQPGDPPGVDFSIDTMDPRITEVDIGKGDEIIPDPYFASGNSGFSGIASTISVSNGVLTATSTGSNPRVSRTMTGLTIGQVYEAEFDAVSFGRQFQIQLSSSSVVAPTGVAFMPAGAGNNRRFVRARFTATATSHNLLFICTTTPAAGTVVLELRKASFKPVLSSGLSYPIQAHEQAQAFRDASNFAALGTNPLINCGRGLLTNGKASQVVLMNRAIGGAGLVGNRWDPETPGDLYAALIPELTSVMTDRPELVPTFHTFGGEWDATVGNISKTDYENEFVKFAAGLRGVPGCANAKIIVSTLIPEYAAANPAVATIVAAQRNLPNLIANLVVVETPSGYQKVAEAFHINANGSRAVGYLHATVV